MTKDVFVRAMCNDLSIVCDETNNTPENVASGTVRVTISALPPTPELVALEAAFRKAEEEERKAREAYMESTLTFMGASFAHIERFTAARLNTDMAWKDLNRAQRGAK